MIPPWLPPSNYFWPVKDCDVLIYDTGYAEKDYIAEIVFCLHKAGAGADIVRYVDPNFETTTFHKE
jgi:hypothetical protein